MRVIITFLLLFALGPVSAQSGTRGTPVPVEEHFRLASGNTAVGFTPDGLRYFAYLDKSGERRIRVLNRDGSVLQAAREPLAIQDGAYCITWNFINGGRKECGIKVIKDGDEFSYVNPDGSRRAPHKFEQGNSRGL